MVNTVRALDMLKSPKASKRYEACEELRVAASLSLEAINALKNATADPDPEVAEAAAKALALHTSQTTEVSLQPAPAQPPALPQVVHSWTRPFIIYGALAGGVPIPLLPWLWLILSISAATKLGW